MTTDEHSDGWAEVLADLKAAFADIEEVVKLLEQEEASGGSA